ncbi:hypothetical protein BDR07DRAFT_1419527, partial [Suillus spraguei]
MRFSFLIAIVVLTAAISASADSQHHHCPIFCEHSKHCRHCEHPSECHKKMCRKI